MKVGPYLLALVLLCSPAAFAQDQQPGKAAPGPALLTVEDAVTIALANNRLIKHSNLEAQKYEFRIDTVRSRRRPEFQFSVLESELLKPLDFTFKQGVFGIYPTPLGPLPVPSVNTKIRTPAHLNTFAMGSINQPLTQQYKIGLGIRAQQLSRSVAQEDVRAQRQKIASEVRAAYYGLCATQAGLQAARQSVTTLQEAKRVSAKYEAEQAILKADALQVQARLARQEYQVAVAENALATQREHLNQLLGRDLMTEFRVAAMPEDDNTEMTLDRAREQAIENRPELRQAKLKQQLAEYDRRIAKAEYIPDVSLTVRYLGIRSIEMVPNNAAAAGLYLSWEPFDWGRRRNAIAEKDKTIQQARNGIEEAQSQILVEVGMRFRKWRETALLLKAQRASKEASAEQFRVVTNKFKEQAALVKDVLQAETQSSDADFQYQQGLSQYWNALADLRKAMGEE